MRLLTGLTFLFLSLSFASAKAMDTKASQAFMFDLETGSILMNKNADKRMPTSSMSKVMTMYMIFEALEDGRIALDDTFEVSEKAWRKGGSKMFVEVGKRVAVEDLIKGVIVQSGNDATIVLAEGLHGSEDAFAAEMTETAVNELGMSNSNFANASGWPDPNHYSTARDLGRLAAAMISQYPALYHYYSIKEFTYSGIRQANRNPLLYRNIGADGIKTGHTDAAGYGLMASGERDGRRVILVLNGMESESERAEESARVLDWGLRNFTNIALFADGAVLGQAPVYLGVQDHVDLVAKGGIKLSLPKDVKDNIILKLEYDSPLPAPIRKGDIVAQMRIQIPDQDDRLVRVVAAQDIAQTGFFGQLGEKLIQWIEQVL